MFDKGVSSNSESWLIGFGSGIGAMFLLGLGSWSCSGFTGGDEPRADDNARCDDAWTAKYVDHNVSDDEQLILDETWCQEHLNMVQTQVDTQQNEVQAEARVP